MASTPIRRRVLSALALFLAALGAVGLYLFQPWRAFTTVRVDETVVVAPDGGTARTLATGSFLSHEHSTSGTVTVTALPDGTATLRLADLRTSDGPALRVWLSDQPVEPTGLGRNLDDGRHVDLGALKGNEGNQNYAVPAGTDLTELRTVTIWCERFAVSFGAAALTLA
ncbi:DM13 domain-containing protein [Nocardia mangyaensis]|uniref:DM13 domain-containing protein n=1 Tax=Nocardia mangyaensis TaxID=2213200 RepID=UPI0026763121|nr:DM13 domain-containing protein [Nocardia mangyaensis]MDO3645834.1 DM13 domain-containing protein [Nocardia mangyaensis]